MEHRFIHFVVFVLVFILNSQIGENVWIPPCQVIVRTRRDSANSINLNANDYMNDNDNSTDSNKCEFDKDEHPVIIPQSKTLPEEYIGNVAFLLVPSGNREDPWSTYIIPPICFPSKLSNQNSTTAVDTPESVTIKKGCNCMSDLKELSRDGSTISKHPGSFIPNISTGNNIEDTTIGLTKTNKITQISSESGVTKSTPVYHEQNEQLIPKHEPSPVHSNPFVRFFNSNQRRKQQQVTQTTRCDYNKMYNKNNINTNTNSNSYPKFIRSNNSPKYYLRN